LTQQPDIKLLTQPFSGKHPSGSPDEVLDTYKHIREARETDDTSLPQGVWKEDLKEADWEKVSLLASDLLENYVKDLQVGAWLAEAWAHTAKAQGITWGCELLIELIKDSWNTLYPLIDSEGNIGARLQILDWLDQKLVASLLEHPITDISTDAEDDYTLANWVDSVYFHHLSRKQSDPVQFLQQQEAPLLSEVMRDVRRSSPNFYKSMEYDLKEAQKKVKKLDQALQEKLPDESFFLELRKKLDEIIDVLPTWKNEATRGQKSKLAPPPETASFDPSLIKDEDQPANHQESITPQKKNERGRHEAFEQLAHIIQTLEKTDPQSPVPVLLKKALSWKDASFSEIMETFSNNPEEALVFIRLLQK
jgi:type VI secretion system protein ImpA